MEKYEKEIIQEINKKWHHDIKKIDGEWVEKTVEKYQKTRDEDLLLKIIHNYSIFKHIWAKAFSQYLSKDIEGGELLHDEIVWASTLKFSMASSRKPYGKAFNAYVVSSLMNQLKNFNNVRQSARNAPKIRCPACGEEVAQIDRKHLEHLIDFKRYKKTFPGYSSVSHDGLVRCPATGDMVPRVTEQHLARAKARQPMTLSEFNNEYSSILPAMPVRCPITGSMMSRIPDDYPSKHGVSEQEFLKKYPDWEGYVTCPFTQRLLFKVTQQHLNDVMLRKGRKKPKVSTMGQFRYRYPRITSQVRQVKVMNPYTGKKVMELTPKMLAAAGTTLRRHLSDYGGIVLNKWYPNLIRCPFTGRKTHMIRTKDLDALGRTHMDFLKAVCRYPLRRYQVKCAIDGKWVDNIWDHLEGQKHHYSPPVTQDEFNLAHGQRQTRITVSTNAYVQGQGDGDSVFIADLFPGRTRAGVSRFEIEDSLLSVAKDDLDKAISKVVPDCMTIEDVYHVVCEKRKVKVPFKHRKTSDRALREILAKIIGGHDFELEPRSWDDNDHVTIIVPSKETIRNRLERLVKSSDIAH